MVLESTKVAPADQSDRILYVVRVFASIVQNGGVSFDVRKFTRILGVMGRLRFVGPKEIRQRP